MIERFPLIRSQAEPYAVREYNAPRRMLAPVPPVNPPPVSPSAGDPFQTAAFVRDARTLIGVPKETFARALADLGALDGFESEGDVTATLAATVGDAGVARVVMRFVRNFSRTRDAVGDKFESQLERTLRTSLSAAQDTPAELTPGELDLLVERARACAGPFPAIDRMEKAATLARATGNSLSEFSLFCDLRPVFDESRKSIEGCVLVTTLKISYFDDEGTSSTAELCLSEADLDALTEEVARARSKLDALKAFAAAKNIQLASPEGD